MQNIFSKLILVFFLGNLFFPIFFTFAFEGFDRIKISEVSPVKIDEEEWFEVQIFPGDGILDLTDFRLGNGKYTPKKFVDFRDDIYGGDNLENLAGGLVNTDFLVGSGASFSGSGSLMQADKGSLLFSLVDPNSSGFFSVQPSPFSLSDSGGNLEIFDGDDYLVDEVYFPKSKSKTKSGKKVRAEVWNRNFDDVDFGVYPLWYSTDEVYFGHSRGEINLARPSFSGEVEVLISEISPNNPVERGGDFVELLVQSGPEKTNLKYARLKHNGSVVWENDSDFFVSVGDRILLYPEKGISAGSGTWELWFWADTSFEALGDFVCYQSGDLSSTEQKRVEKFLESGWRGDCVDIAELVKAESVARISGAVDTDSSLDFFRHFLGSPKKENINEGELPVAIIDIQRSGKVIGTPPFSLNVTGENSFDPDGDFDLKNFVWKKNGEIFSKVENPGAIKIEELGDYLVELLVEDYMGNFGRAEVKISVVKSSGSVPTFQRKNYALQNWSKSQKAFEKRYKYISGDLSRREQEDFFQEKYATFFDDFLAEAPENFFATLYDKKPLEMPKDLKFGGDRGGTMDEADLLGREFLSVKGLRF